MARARWPSTRSNLRSVWFEDYGSGQLVSGVATVNIDPAYAQTVNTGVEYHVFLTPDGDCQGLYVTARTATGFEVRELQQGRSNVAFDYRIIALRRGYETKRLADVTNATPRAAIESPSGARRVVCPELPLQSKGGSQNAALSGDSTSGAPVLGSGNIKSEPARRQRADPKPVCNRLEPATLRLTSVVPPV